MRLNPSLLVHCCIHCAPTLAKTTLRLMQLRINQPIVLHADP